EMARRSTRSNESAGSIMSDDRRSHALRRNPAVSCYTAATHREPSSRMAPRQKIPRPTVKRLSLYLRELEANLERGHSTTSSKQLGQALGLTDAQVRKDLAYFGQFGHPGIGYRVPELIARLRKILGIDQTWHA